MKNDFFMGDLYPNMGMMTTRATTIPEPGDQASMTKNNQDIAIAHPIAVSGEQVKGHYFGLIIIVGVLLLLGVRM